MGTTVTSTLQSPSLGPAASLSSCSLRWSFVALSWLIWILFILLLSCASNEENKDLKLLKHFFFLVPGLNTVEFYNMIQIDLECCVLLTSTVKRVDCDGECQRSLHWGKEIAAELGRLRTESWLRWTLCVWGGREANMRQVCIWESTVQAEIMEFLQSQLDLMW